MTAMLLSAALVAVSWIPATRAYYSEFLFVANGTCPDDETWSCPPPLNVCVLNSVTDEWYCCSGGDYPICRKRPVGCGGGNSTTPASGQIFCGSQSDGWCCLDGEEICTQRSGQINVCVATEANVIANVSDALLNQTYSSLSSASPSASVLTLDGASLASAAAATSTSSSSSSASSSIATSSSQTSPATTTTSPASSSSSTHLSGGTIGGIVVGCVLGISLIAAAVFFALRKRRGWHDPAQDPSGSPFSPGDQMAEKRGPGGPGEIGSPPPPWTAPVEMGLFRGYEELPTEPPRSEMYVEPSELPGSTTSK